MLLFCLDVVEEESNADGVADGADNVADPVAETIDRVSTFASSTSSASLPSVLSLPSTSVADTK